MILCLKQPSHRIDNGKVSNSFRSKANLIIERMRHVLVKDRTIHSSVEEYLGITNMSKMFPRAVQYIKDSKSFSLVSKQTHLDEYIGAMSHLHQIATLSHQINEDIIKSQRPKYLAHQLALLYQSISSLKNIEPLSQHKKSIEENFKAIKSVLINEDQPNDPVPDELRKCVWELTNQITRIVESLPSTLTQHALLPSCLLIQT
ncbi:uncharacterized protein LOC112555381 isoform X2 [Pomacea canaliculata]|uniref:uncharacterized protein LOC112555381 isoform X2 n=1 Tax=Pomacea canaliculata TaxID=400727 RepID=UPI000D7399E0|nr:uncharacterized protein LOC112555381 isoform X2 [Pomacea canaliculata]